MKNFLRIGLAGVAFSGCAAEEVEVGNVDQSLSSDATNGGTPGFFFLAPLGNPPTPFPGTFDGSLKSRLTITIHDTDCLNQGTVGAVVQSYNTVLVYPSVGEYKVNHNVSGAIYVSGRCYRVFPRLDGVPLGFADVQALPNTPSTQAVPGYVKWGIGANRPIVFRIENLDPDGDGVLSHIDNCDFNANADQTDTDGDGLGDACDVADADGDGIADGADNCPNNANADQANADGDTLGDVCDVCPADTANDADGDGVCEVTDNCDVTANADQTDSDGDGAGDACDVCPVDTANDADGDGVCEVTDNCDITANSDQTDTDGDGLGDACDVCPLDTANDADGDGVCEAIDNCDVTANPGQEDSDGDGLGDACDANCAVIPGATGYWRAESLEDSIGNADGVFTGGAGFGVGKFGQGFAFGGNGFMRADGFDQVGAFSVSFWAKADVFQAVNVGLLASAQNNVASSDTFQVDWNGSKGYRLKVGSTVAPTLNVNIGAASLTQFQHITITYDGAQALAVYLDGVQTNSGTWVGPQLQFSALKLGTNRAENLIYRGVIDDVAVFNRALSAGEVASIFAQPNGICP